MQPVWPIANRRPTVQEHGGRIWGAPRGDRRHAGVDVYAQRHDVVVSPLPGTVVAHQGWSGPGTRALLIESDDGPVMLLGAVAPNSWEEWGLGIGDHVEIGEPVARVGVYPAGSSMLHFELYVNGTRQNKRWYAGSPPPPGLLDPTPFLEAAADGDVVILPDEPSHDDPADDPVLPPEKTNPPEHPADGLAGGALIALLLGVAFAFGEQRG